MIISRTPFRISFFGGGTDHLDYFKNSTGKVLSSTINKYCYISISKSPLFVTNKYQISWSEIEKVNNIKDIKHPTVRNSLKFLQFKEGLSIFHRGDLPARSGMGSSSSFTVALLNGLNFLQGKFKSDKHELALQAQYIESSLNGEKVGFQDQFASSYGGINEINFNYIKNKVDVDVNPILISSDFKREIESSLILCYLNNARNASIIEEAKFENKRNSKSILNDIKQFSSEAISSFKKECDIDKLGKNLDFIWNIKKKLHPSVSNKKIDDLYNYGLKCGALGGKVLGAGGGGFLLFVVPQDRMKVFKSNMNMLMIEFLFEDKGATVFNLEDKND
ncbi:kinase [Alphaproteobacteria bacterium]|nr:kinase [Alphaproteobacteria bacterium]